MAGRFPTRVRLVLLLTWIVVTSAACGAPATSKPVIGGAPTANVPPAAGAPAPSGPSRATEPAPKVEAPTTVRLGLVSPSWNTQLPVAVAHQLGFFRDAGLVVESQTVGSGGAVMVAMLVSGEVDTIISGIEAQVAGILAGAPAVIVASVLDKVDYALAGSKGMTGIHDLRGKLIGTTGPGTHSDFAVVESLKRVGLVRDRDYTIRSIGGTSARLAALYAGQVDAVPLSSGERVRVEHDGYPVILDLGQVIPEFPFTVLGAHTSFASAQPAQVTAMIRALARASDAIRQDKDRAVELAKAHGLEGDPVQQRRALDYVANDFEVRLSKENLAAFMAVRELPGRPDDVFDGTFLDQALRAR